MMSETTVLPLQKRISKLLEQIAESRRIRDRIPYPTVRKSLEGAEKNTLEALEFNSALVKEVILWRAVVQNGYEKRQNSSVTLEETIRDFFSDNLSDLYHQCDEISEAYLVSQLGSALPPEIYLWIDDVVNGFSFKGSKKSKIPPIVFQQSSQLINDMQSDSLAKKVDTLINLSRTDVRFNLDVTKGRPVTFPYDKMVELFVVNFLPGGARNPVLWPVLIHESMHIIDKQWTMTEQFKKFVETNSGGFLDLDEHPDKTLNWMNEIAIDMISLSSAGPMFTYSLLSYFDYLPYVESPDYPRIDARLYMMRKYLEDPRNKLPETFDSCREFYASFLRKRKLNKLKYQSNFDKLYDLTIKWMEYNQLTQFKDTLESYLQTGESNVSISSVFGPNFSTGDQDLDHLPYVDPVFSYPEITRLIFSSKVPLAIHPTILLNVVLSQLEAQELDSKDTETLVETLVKSVHQWKIKTTWSDTVRKSPTVTG